MDIRKRTDASVDCILQAPRGVGLRKPDHRLNNRQYIPGSMLGLANQGNNQCFASFALADVSGNFRGTNDFSRRTLDGRNRQRNIDEAPVLAATNSFIMVNAFSTLHAFED